MTLAMHGCESRRQEIRVMGSLNELTNVPIDQLIMSIGTGIATAQLELDKTSMKIAEFMSGTKAGTKVQFGDKQYSLIALGFTPTFYQFVETLIEVKVSISTTQSSSSSRTSSETSTETYWDRGVTTNATSVSANYASKYQYSAEGSSLVRTKLVPVPAPAILNQRIRALVDQEAKLP
jgi:hypothetical protein